MDCNEGIRKTSNGDDIDGDNGDKDGKSDNEQLSDGPPLGNKKPRRGKRSVESQRKRRTKGRDNRVVEHTRAY